MERHINDCKERVDIGSYCEQLRSRILDMLSEVTRMWDGNLGTIRTVKHRTDPDSPIAKPVQNLIAKPVH